MSIDIEHLRTFLEVNRTRHFGKAAQQLCVTQSTVSARIRLLEDIIGRPLFVRARHDIRLTLAGRRLLRYAESIINTWNRARQDIAVAEDTAPPLTVAGVPSLWDIMLLDWLQALCESDPQLSLYSEVLSMDFITRRLLEGTLDLAFLFEPPRLSELEIRSLAAVDLLMVSSRPNLSLDDALGRGYILVDWGTSFSIEHARCFPDAPPAGLHMDLGRLARDFIFARGGTAYLAEPMVRDGLRQGSLFRVEDAPTLKRSAHAIFPVASPRRELIEKCLALFETDEALARKTVGRQA